MLMKPTSVQNHNYIVLTRKQLFLSFFFLPHKDANNNSTKILKSFMEEHMLFQGLSAALWTIVSL